MDGRLVGVEKSLAAIDARLDRVLEVNARIAAIEGRVTLLESRD
jgi:hypothetical protein